MLAAVVQRGIRGARWSIGAGAVLVALTSPAAALAQEERAPIPDEAAVEAAGADVPDAEGREPDGREPDALAEAPTPLVPPGGVPVIWGPGDRPAPPVTPEPAPEPTPPPEPPPPPPVYVVEISPRVGFATGSSFDDALVAHRYVGNVAIPTSYVGVAFPVGVEWLWIGGRFGFRGRSWQHPDREGPVLTAGDLLLTAQARFGLGSVFELGAIVYGGAGVADLRLNGVATGAVMGRFGLEAVVSFRLGRHFAFGPRGGWDFFQWEGMNADGHGVEIGGPFVGLTMEGRE